jgi:hypothetical protein
MSLAWATNKQPARAASKQVTLHDYVQGGNVQEVRKWIEAEKKKKKPTSAIVDVVDSEGQTPLIVACRCKRDDMVELLLNEHADVTLKDSDQWTALHCGMLAFLFLY